MFADNFALGRYHIAIVRGQVFLQKFAERALADKANARAVFFGGGGQPEIAGKAAHFGFFHVAQREQGALQLKGLQAVEEIALVFAAVRAFEQIMHAIAHFFAGVMPCGDSFCALRDGVV